MRRFSKQGKTVLKTTQELTREERKEIVKQEALALGAKVAKAAPTAGAQKRTKAQAALSQGVAETLISKAGGIFLGEKQLKELGVIDKGVTVPPVPQKFSRAFLNANHPLRGGKMAAHIILGFDPKTREWYCFEKSIVPGSLGTDGRGLSGPKQDNLLLDEHRKPKTVQGMKYTSPTDYHPIKRVLDNVIKLQRKQGVAVGDLPFYRVWGRTSDTENAGRGCRVLLGASDRHGSFVYGHFSAAYADGHIGLLAGWN
jgi:hypothetical protein